MSKLKKKPDSTGDELIDLSLDSADFTKFTPEEKVKYRFDMTTDRDLRNQFAKAERLAKEKGRAEGIAEGRAKGIAK